VVGYTNKALSFTRTISKRALKLHCNLLETGSLEKPHHRISNSKLAQYHTSHLRESKRVERIFVNLLRERNPSRLHSNYFGESGEGGRKKEAAGRMGESWRVLIDEVKSGGVLSEVTIPEGGTA